MIIVHFYQYLLCSTVYFDICKLRLYAAIHYRWIVDSRSSSQSHAVPHIFLELCFILLLWVWLRSTSVCDMTISYC